MLKMRKMKDSGIEWIGEIPEGWEISKVSYFYEVQLGKMLQPQKKSETDTEEKYLCAANVGKNSLSLDTLKTMWFSQTEKHQFDLKEGDLLVVEGGDVASCAIIETPVRNLFFQNALHRVRPLHNESIAFLRYWLMTAKSYGYIDLICNKATIAHFSKEKFIALPIPVIPQDIQSKIVSFLDLECKQIDDLLSKTRSSIEEYKKLKQAVITQAVTKGVRGEREMKDSGVEWAGLVPHHWGVAKIGSIGQTSSGATPLRSKEASFFDDATIRWVRTLDLNDSLVYDSSEKITELALASSACSIMPKGTVCVAMYGGAGTIGKCGLLMSDCSTNQAVCSIVCNREIVSPIFLLMQLLALKSYWMKYAVGTRKDPNISQDVVARMKILIPPLDEQKEITDYLDAKCAEIDKLIAKKEQLVKELESYKKSLIYEVVTGKREV